jgi:hypothetical protein
MGISSAKADSSRCAGARDGYVKSLDPLAGKEEGKRAKAERGRKKEVHARTHSHNDTRREASWIPPTGFEPVLPA